MNKVIKMKLLSFISLFVIAFLCFASAVFGLNTTSVNAETKTSFTSAELGIKGAKPITYSEFVTGSDVTLDSDDIGFKMGKGALVRADKTTPGIRYIVNIGAGIDSVQAGETYNINDYTYDYYILFNTGDKYLFVKGQPSLKGGEYQYSAAITFDGVSAENFADYKALVINGQGIMVVTKKDNASNKIVVLTEASDNERTMESVVNTAKLNDGFVDCDEQTVAVMDSFVPSDDSYIGTKGLYAERANKSLSYEDVISAHAGAKAVYYDTKKYTAEDDAIALSNVGAANNLVLEELSAYVTVVDADGKFHNYKTVKIADTVISKCEDLDSLSSDKTNGEVHGYFIVSNDVIWDGEYYATPLLENALGSIFCGVLDGDGHKVEFGISAGGLFGAWTRACIVQNISLIVKGVNPPSNYMNADNTKDSIYVIMAKAAQGNAENSYSTLRNVYATFDIENFEPAIGQIGAGQWSWFGFYGSHVDTTNYVNVILDLSKVKGVKEKLENKETFPYGLFTYNTDHGCLFNNVYVIWSNPYLGTFSTNYIASNDKYAVTTCLGASTITVLSGVYRYDTLAKLADNVTRVGNFIVSAEGVVYTDAAVEEGNI